MKKILILKTGNTVQSLRDNGEDFEDWIIAGSGFSASYFITVEVATGGRLPDLDSCRAIIVTGSPAYVTDQEPWSETSAEFLRAATRQGVPILGICYGHQLLAHCLGGQVGFHPQGREIGTVAVDLTETGRRDALLGNLPDTFLAQVSHSQSVLVLPDQAVLLAGNSFEPHQAFRVGDCAWGVQFHPEFSDRVTRAYITERRAQLLTEELNPDRLLAAVRPTPEAAQLLRRFVEMAVGPVGGD